MSENNLVYSIQQTYILTRVLTPEKSIITCDQRIDIPTIEPLPSVRTVFNAGSSDEYMTVIPCIELAGELLSEFNLTFETNEGVTVLPIKIATGEDDPLENPYTHFRYVLVLPSGATGVKSCKLIHKATGKEVQHNFTFGIMPPPYNYDNALFGGITVKLGRIEAAVTELAGAVPGLSDKINALKLTAKSPFFDNIYLPKGAGKQTINIEDGVLLYHTTFIYPSSSNPTTHKPKITLHGRDGDFVYTLSLERNQTMVTIDLLTGMITAYDGYTGEILKQFKLYVSYHGFETLSFDNFDDIDIPYIPVEVRGARVI